MPDLGIGWKNIVDESQSSTCSWRLGFWAWLLRQLGSIWPLTTKVGFERAFLIQVMNISFYVHIVV